MVDRKRRGQRGEEAGGKQQQADLYPQYQSPRSEKRRREALRRAALARDAERQAALEAAWASGKLPRPTVVAYGIGKKLAYTCKATVMLTHAQHEQQRQHRPRSPTFHEMLRPLVDSPFNRLFRAEDKLKLRATAELDSEPAEPRTLPAGTLVRVVQRLTLPDGTERAAIAREGLREGIIGWCTVGKQGTRKVSPTRTSRASRYFAEGDGAAAGGGSASSVEAVAAGPAAAEAALAGERRAGEKGRSNTRRGSDAGAEGGASESTKGSDQASAGAARSRQEQHAEDAARQKKTREARFMSSEELEALARSFTSRALAEEAKIDESKDPLPVRLGKALGKVHVKIPEFVAQWAKRGKEPITKMEVHTYIHACIHTYIHAYIHACVKEPITKMEVRAGRVTLLAAEAHCATAHALRMHTAHAHAHACSDLHSARAAACAQACTAAHAPAPLRGKAHL